MRRRLRRRLAARAARQVREHTIHEIVKHIQGMYDDNKSGSSNGPAGLANSGAVAKVRP